MMNAAGRPMPSIHDTDAIVEWMREGGEMTIEQLNPACDCAERTPTYPTYRDTEHLPTCVWWWVQKHTKETAALLETIAELRASAQGVQAQEG